MANRAFMVAAAGLLLLGCSSKADEKSGSSRATESPSDSAGADAGGAGAEAGAKGDDGFGNPDAATSSRSGGSGGSGATPIVPPTTCAETTVRASRVTPTVILIVDQSSSMNDPFEGNRSRWNVLRDFLLEEPDGLIASLQDQVRFGLALYSAESGGQAPDPIGECPMVTQVAATLDNFAAIQQAYAGAEPIEDTPTGDAIDVVLNGLMLDPDPDAEQDPIVFVLATDGEPDQCEQLDPQEGQQEAVAAVERAFGMRIRTFIISVGDEIGEEHQQAMANAGIGHQPGDPDAEYWVAGDDQSLRAALSDIVGSQVGCDVELNGSVDGDACMGRVTINGHELDCDSDDGWVLSDPRHIRLNGQACEDLKNGNDVLLEVAFPCGVDVVF